MKPSGKAKDKAAKKHRGKTKGHPGLVKVAAKPKAGTGGEAVRMRNKLNKQLTGSIGTHIEQVMFARIQSDRGPTAPSVFKVVKQIEGYEVEKKKKKTRKEKQAAKEIKVRRGRVVFFCIHFFCRPRSCERPKRRVVEEPSACAGDGSCMAQSVLGAADERMNFSGISDFSKTRTKRGVVDDARHESQARAGE